MSLTGGHLDALLAAGATAEQIVALVKADMIEREKALDGKRAKDAERQRRKRHAESRDVTRTDADSHGVTDKGSLEVSPPAPPLPKPSKQSPLSPPIVEAEKREAIASCLRLAYPPPEGVTEEQWAAFCKQRRKKLNDRSYLLLTNKLAKLNAAGWPSGEMIDRAIESGWETVFAPNQAGKADPPKRYVSASGYEYRGPVEQVIREAERRGDTQTMWLAKADLSRAAAQ